eukprot:CAMPEP_0172762410 /NCGR_PEP_ID=MMETSP1074-20121228/173449_1 /TAXON_ID=2916 /ORGANISM="Ceratium fusus, Strain PA161109" /LENGTH=141 /DNA_ID=CAMNT_0013596801 /DNA_START=58 /DNA_END=481 /DNA_ORIENTATION=+
MAAWPRDAGVETCNKLLVGLARQRDCETFGFSALLCGGKSWGLPPIAAVLKRSGGVELVVDHSQEEREAPEDWARNLESKINLLQSMRQELGGRARFMPFKATSVMSPILLERMAALIMQDEHWCKEIVDPTPSLKRDELL